MWEGRGDEDEDGGMEMTGCPKGHLVGSDEGG